MTFEDDLLALEQRVLAGAAGNFLAAVDELRQMLVTGAGGVRQRLARVAITDFENIVRNGILEAHDLGGAQGLADAAKLPDLAVGTLQGAKRALSAAATGALLEPVTGLSALATAAVGTGLTLLVTGSSPDVALSPVFGAANTVKGVVTSQVNQAANRAVATVADYASAPLVWQSERDACVYCLDLAGKVVRPGEVFPESNTYAPQPASYGFILEPPRHRNCRCTLAVLYDPGYADALEREAQRSILRGYSLKSESQALRIRAAARLLATDPIAPKSVKAYAAKAVKEGKFPNGRAVPGGSPRLVVK